MSKQETLNSDSPLQPGAPRRRTLGIWIVLGFSLWTVIGMLFAWFQVLNPPPDAELEKVAQSMGVDVEFARPNVLLALLGSANTALVMAGAWQLFMLRASAKRMFLASAALALVGQLYAVSKFPAIGAFLAHPLGAGVALYSVVVYGLLIWYSNRLLRRGVLR